MNMQNSRLAMVLRLRRNLKGTEAMRFLVHVYERLPLTRPETAYQRHKVGTLNVDTIEKADAMAQAVSMADNIEAEIKARVHAWGGAFIDVPVYSLASLVEDLHQTANSISKTLAR